jgi:hypothetical protein
VLWHNIHLWWPIFSFTHVLRDKGTKITRTKWWKIKGKVQHTFKERVAAEGPWDEEGDAYIMGEDGNLHLEGC